MSKHLQWIGFPRALTWACQATRVVSALGVAWVMALGLAGCGGSGESGVVEAVQPARVSAMALTAQAQTPLAAPPAQVSVASTQLPEGGSVSGTIAQPRQVDSYTFTGQAGDRVLLSVGRTWGQLAPGIKLMGPDQRVLRNTFGTVVAATTWTLTQAGTYIVQINDGGHVEPVLTGGYELHFVRAPGAAEHGLLAAGGSRTGTITVGDLDTYSFQGQAGESVVLSLARSQGALSPRLRVHAPDGSQVSDHSDVAVAQTALQLQQTGSYVVVVSDGHVEPREIGDYRLHFVRALGPAELGWLKAGGSRSGSIDAGDLDSFAFFAQAGETVAFSLARVSGDLAPRLRVLAPSGATLRDVSAGTVAATTLEITRPGLHIVVVSDGHVEARLQGDYALHMVRAPGPAEHGSLVADGVREGSIEVGDLDSYVFSAQVGEAIRLDARRNSGQLAPRLRVFAPDGRLLHSTSGSESATLSFTAPSTASYLVVLDDGGHVEPRLTGDYSLSFSASLDRFSYAALGDSYASGEGLAPYIGPNDWYLTIPSVFGLGPALGLDGGCHRSDKAYAFQLRRPGEATTIVNRSDIQFDFLACTGAATRHIRPDGDALHGQAPQLSTGNAIDASRDLVTLTLGGNDAQWTFMLMFCFAHPACQATRPFEPHSSLTLEELATPLAIAYAQAGIQDVHRQIRDATPNAATIVLGYPLLVSGRECPALALPGHPESRLSSDEQAFLRRANEALNLVIQASAAQVGLHHVPVAAHFADHEACGLQENWVNGIVPLNPAASFHPTPRGQAEMARLVNDYLRVTASGWPLGYLANGLPRNPAPLKSGPQPDRSKAAALQTELPKFGGLAVLPTAAPPDCRSAHGAVVPGEPARFLARGYRPGETVTLALYIDNQGLPLGNAVADAAGDIDARFTVPASLGGATTGTAQALGAGAHGKGLLTMTQVRVVASATADSDGDGVPDLCDNCSAVPNLSQQDADGDGYGDVCDADLNNDGIVNALDLALFRQAMGRKGDALPADLDGNGVIDNADLAIFGRLFGRPPGPAYSSPSPGAGTRLIDRAPAAR